MEYKNKYICVSALFAAACLKKLILGNGNNTDRKILKVYKSIHILMIIYSKKVFFNDMYFSNICVNLKTCRQTSDMH